MPMTPVIDTKVIFKGVSSVRFSATVQASAATAAWEWELPILNDSFSITQAAGSLTPVNILGYAGAWCVSGEMGDIDVSFTIASIKDTLLGVFYEKTAAELETADETHGTVTGSFKGYGYNLKKDMIEGSMLIISENQEWALFIKNIQGYPALSLPDGNGSPMGVAITGKVVGGNAECDFALLKWTPSV